MFYVTWTWQTYVENRSISLRSFTTFEAKVDLNPSFGTVKVKLIRTFLQKAQFRPPLPGRVSSIYTVFY